MPGINIGEEIFYVRYIYVYGKRLYSYIIYLGLIMLLVTHVV